jgi:hypothetical protein
LVLMKIIGSISNPDYFRFSMTEIIGKLILLLNGYKIQ